MATVTHPRRRDRTGTRATPVGLVARGTVQENVATTLTLVHPKGGVGSSTSHSIAALGLLQPVVMRRLEDGGYQQIAGHRRVLAAQLLRLAAQPASFGTQRTNAAYQREKDVRSKEVVHLVGELTAVLQAAPISDLHPLARTKLRALYQRLALLVD